MRDSIAQGARLWCFTCNDDGPHFDCPRPGETSFDRSAICTWLGDHRYGHDVRFLGQEQAAERARQMSASTN